ncbi:GNAT family N-acetyltransferase [Variovorax terrae]|uniref:N-acetyltransferase domain-containing protein n=1 Tax=Variovorax terrae TaxID=2923278 RepID=A0A9X1VRG4_9BURK|nr:GNAT family N-acetyltransferase [Variovorax terrae]MCJ0762040.1 hypothetical protein [Variovorax terrae]
MSQPRFAQASDIPRLVELGRRIHAESRYAWMPYSAQRAWRYLEQALPSKQHCAMVVQQSDGSLAALLLASAQQYAFSNNFAVQIDVFYVLPQLRGSPAALRLLGALRKWADNRDVVEIWLLDRFTGAPNRNHRLLEKLGLTAVGAMHAKWIDRS